MQGTVAELIAEALISNGIDCLYCVPGYQNDDFFDAVHRRSGKLRPVVARHEQGAAYMATGAALATGRAQAFCVVPGPGLLNASAALATARSVNAPVLAIAGQLPLRGIGKGYGLLHEIPDQLGTMRSLTKSASRITGGRDALPVLQGAFAAMASGRPGPVGIEVPMDVWNHRTKLTPEKAVPGDLECTAPDSDELLRAAEILSSAERPMIYVGGGAQNHGKEIAELAEALSAPVASFCMGRGVVSSDNPLSIDFPAAHDLWKSVDVVLALGTRLKWPQLSWGIDSDLKVIHVNLDPEDISRISEPDSAIVADLADVLPVLSETAKGRPAARGKWLEAVADAKARVAARIRSRLAPQLEWLDAIRAELPRDGIFVEELTQTGYVARFAFPVYGPRTYISPSYQGTLGFGIPTAIGAANARRDVPAVSISGDGGAMFAVAELAAAVQHGIPLSVVVFNDGAYGNVRAMQEDHYGGRVIASDLSEVDFVKLAESLGATGMRARTPEQLRQSLNVSIAGGGTSLIEVPVGRFPSPWEFILLPKVRGAPLRGSGTLNPKSLLV